MSLNWLPNAVTLLRIAAAPLVGWLLWQLPGAASGAEAYTISLTAFIGFSLASLTDWLDGYLARALKATSELGAKLDLWADKVIVAAVLIGAFAIIPAIALIGLFSLTGRDLYIMRLRAHHPQVNLKATFLAKSKTAIVMAGMAVGLAGLTLGYDDGGESWAGPVQGLGALLFAMGCGLSLYTGYQYVNAARSARA